jgi:hypothetical protein
MSPANGKVVGPVDLEGLALQVIQLSGQLERVWSDALEKARMGQAEEELNGELGALVSAMTAAVEETDEKLQAAGVDPKIYSWPFDPDLVKRLRGDPEPRERRAQLVIAQMIAIRELLVAFKALSEPSGEQLDSVSESRTEWFEAGAFSLLKDRARLLLRVTREVDRATAVLLGQEVPTKLDLSVEAAFASLRSARDGYSRGDLEAALIHCRAALRGALESLPFISAGDERLLTPGLLFSRVLSLNDYAASLQLLDAEVEALQGRAVDPGIALPLVEGLLPVIARIVNEPPIMELQKIISSQPAED